MTDERDLRDPALDAAWRAQSTEMPPPPLDAAILAAAHRAVRSAPERIGPGREATRPWRWWTPLAAAAVIGVIAIGALQLLPQEPDPTQVVVSDMPSTGAKPDARVAPSAAAMPPPPASSPLPSPLTPQSPSSPSPPPPPSPTAQSARAMAQSEPSPPKLASPAPTQNAARSRAAMADSAPRQERPMAAPPPGAPQEASSDSASHEEKIVGAARPAPEPFPARSDAKQSPASTAGAVAPMLAKRAMRDEMQRQRSPDDFVARIRTLFAEANMAEAQRELLDFRAAYADADARLPADLRPWAATVPRN